MSGGFRLTIRTGPRVRSERYDALEPALDALAIEVDALRGDVRREAVDARIRRFEPDELVAARIELSGPGRLWPAVHAGIDLHGDGSEVAWTGRVQRREVEPVAGESPVTALRRELTA